MIEPATQWAEFPGGISELLRGIEYCPDLKDMSPIGAMVYLEFRVMGHCYPGVDPKLIGFDNAQVRYVDNRLFYRFARRVVEMFGPPQFKEPWPEKEKPRL